jgi:hypothetical protein
MKKKKDLKKKIKMNSLKKLFLNKILKPELLHHYLFISIHFFIIMPIFFMFLYFLLDLSLPLIHGSLKNSSHKKPILLNKLPSILLELLSAF